MQDNFNTIALALAWLLPVGGLLYLALHIIYRFKRAQTPRAKKVYGFCAMYMIVATALIIFGPDSAKGLGGAMLVVIAWLPVLIVPAITAHILWKKYHKS